MSLLRLSLLEWCTLLMFLNKLFGIHPSTAAMPWLLVFAPLVAHWVQSAVAATHLSILQKEMTANTDRLIAENRRNRAEQGSGVTLPLGNPASMDN